MRETHKKRSIYWYYSILEIHMVIFKVYVLFLLVYIRFLTFNINTYFFISHTLRSLSHTFQHHLFLDVWSISCTVRASKCRTTWHNYYNSYWKTNRVSIKLKIQNFSSMKLTRQFLIFHNLHWQYHRKIMKKNSKKLFQLLWNLPRYLDADKIMVSRKIEYISANSTCLSTMATHPKRT